MLTFCFLGCLSNATCLPFDEYCDLETFLCTAPWLGDLGNMIANGSDSVDIALEVEKKLDEAAGGGTLVGLADLMTELLALRDDQTANGTGQEQAMAFTESILRSEEKVFLSYDGWRDIFDLEVRYKAASVYLR
jgi:hypothetical protein